MFPCRSLTETSAGPLASRVIGWARLSSQRWSGSRPELRSPGSRPAGTPSMAKSAVTVKAVQVETAAVIVHAEQEVRQRSVLAPGCGEVSVKVGRPSSRSQPRGAGRGRRIGAGRSDSQGRSSGPASVCPRRSSGGTLMRLPSGPCRCRPPLRRRHDAAAGKSTS